MASEAKTPWIALACMAASMSKGAPFCPKLKFPKEPLVPELLDDDDEESDPSPPEDELNGLDPEEKSGNCGLGDASTPGVTVMVSTP